MKPTNARLKAMLVDQGVRISDYQDEVQTLREHLKQARDFDDQALINGLRQDIKVRDGQLLTAGQTIKTREDRIAYLEDQLTAHTN